MAKQKYNWEALKREYFESDIEEAKAFMEAKFSLKSWSGAMNKNTRGWWRQKQEHKKKVLEKALENKIVEDAKALEIPMIELMKTKKAVLGLLIKKVSNILKNDGDINVYEQEKILNMVKRELGEPLNINNNLNTNTVKTEELNEEDKEFLSLLVEKRYGGNKTKRKIE